MPSSFGPDPPPLFFRGVDVDPPSLKLVLERAIEVGASDFMVRRGIPIFYKVGGNWYQFSDEFLGETAGYVEELGALGGFADLPDLLLKEKEIDFSFAVPAGHRFRINISLTSDGPLVVGRIIRQELPTLEELGFTEASLQAIYRALKRKRGLILVTGVTGSGKSTTLAAMINWLNTHTASNIITIEDPIEFVFVSQKSAIHQRELGAHTLSFAKALRSAMRQAPDVILVGEMRDRETVKAALTAAETGHLVLSTLHTKSAAETVTRIVDILPAEDKPQAAQQLASSLSLVISQKLLPALGKGRRVLAYEMFVKTDAIQSLIARMEPNIESIVRDVMRSGGVEGMALLEARLAALVKEGATMPEVAYLAANRPDELERQLELMGVSLTKLPDLRKRVGGESGGGEALPSPPRRLFGGG